MRFPSITVVSYPCSVIPTRLSLRWKPGGSLYPGALHAAILLRELGKATKHIHMEFYIFEDDAIGRLVRDVLMEKARAGVEVRVIYDDVGCWHVPNRF